MNNINRLLVAAIISATTFLASCEKNNHSTQRDITVDVVGTYIGNITYSAKESTNDGITDATAVVTRVNDYTVQIHCYGGDIDTTYNLVLYPDGSEMMTGLTAEDFEEMYGYIPEEMQKNMQDYMGGNMGNGDMMGNNCNWMNFDDHMSGNHDDNDDHNGSFNMYNSTFQYTFDEKTNNSRDFRGKNNNKQTPEE